VEWTDKQKNRQLRARLLAAGLAPAVLICAGTGWLWALLGGLCAALFYILIEWLLRLTGGSLAAAAERAAGKTAGRVILLLEALWTLLAAARAAGLGAWAFPEDAARPLAAPVLLALAVWAAMQSPGAGARCAAAISGLLAAVFGVLLLSALPDLRAENLRPWGSARGGAAAFAALLFPAAALCARPDGDSRLSGDASAALALMAAAASLAAAGCLSPALAAAEPLPFYALVKSLTVFGVLERFEPLYSAAVLASGFCLVSLLLDAGAALLRRAGSFDRASALPLLLYLPLFALSSPAARISEEIWAVGATVFWGILPVLTLVIVLLKKVRKKE
jgi:hypothetical protein